MSSALEHLSTSLVTSGPYRRLTGQGIGRALIHSQAYRGLLLRKSYLTSYLAALRRPEAFQDVRTLCLFLGHNKSGTSLLGSLLDAHPDAAVADDMDVLRFVEAGFSRAQLCHVLAKGARRDFLKGRVTARRVQAYSFLVPGQWQGRIRRGYVVGDSTSGSTTRRLAQDPALLDRVRHMADGAAVRFLLVVRNPFDPISYIMVRGGRSFENAIDHYFTNCAAVAALRQRIDAGDVLTVHYEKVVASPAAQLSRVCGFLGLEADEAYVAACRSVVHPSPERSRERVAWEPRWQREVEERMQAYDFLQGYSFEG
jgi:hypothetical protein